MHKGEPPEPRRPQRRGAPSAGGFGGGASTPAPGAARANRFVKVRPTACWGRGGAPFWAHGEAVCPSSLGAAVQPGTSRAVGGRPSRPSSPRRCTQAGHEVPARRRFFAKNRRNVFSARRRCAGPWPGLRTPSTKNRLGHLPTLFESEKVTCKCRVISMAAKPRWSDLSDLMQP